MSNCDGNLAALDTYLREQDLIEEGEEHLQSLKEDISNDLEDAFIQGNENVIEAVEEWIAEHPQVIAQELPSQVLNKATERLERTILENVWFDLTEDLNCPDDFMGVRIRFKL
jgi:hypothetical protein